MVAEIPQIVFKQRVESVIMRLEGVWKVGRSFIVVF